MEKKIPRRIQIEKMIPAELAISSAIEAVENLGADVFLTEAVILLGQAKEKVAYWYDEKCDKHSKVDCKGCFYTTQPVTTLTTGK